MFLLHSYRAGASARRHRELLRKSCWNATLLLPESRLWY